MCTHLRKVQSEVDNVLTSVETRVQDAVLTAIENLVILEWNWPRSQPMRLQDKVWTVLYWNRNREIFKVISEAYEWPLLEE